MSAPVPEVDAGLVEVLRATLAQEDDAVDAPGWWYDDTAAHVARAVQGYVEGRVAGALEDAALAYETEAVGLKPGGWGSNPTDQALADFAVATLNWLRSRATDATSGDLTAPTPDGGREGGRGGEGA